ncbi:MAG: PepSY domain-containing protein [candidate division KSB1 bacterium]|nr:PepSY domain-containing protein [candidate division KSB1 bacterium]
MKISRAQAEQIAMGKIADSHLLGCALNWESGKWIYAVRARNSKGMYEVFIDAETGELIDIVDETAKYQMKVIQGTAVMGVVDLLDRDAAEQAALQAYPGIVQEWKAVVDSTGHLAFSFDIQTAAGGFKKVIVAAETRDIIKIK